ncbi:hypothetical protein HDU97_000481 [Phlyctochytrium planicorne]|nr:hypothetical protein HDU97_000481 [Phlyctochytrium planicorne]
MPNLPQEMLEAMAKALDQRSVWRLMKANKSLYISHSLKSTLYSTMRFKMPPNREILFNNGPFIKHLHLAFQTSYIPQDVDLNDLDLGDDNEMAVDPDDEIEDVEDAHVGDVEATAEQDAEATVQEASTPFVPSEVEFGDWPKQLENLEHLTIELDNPIKTHHEQELLWLLSQLPNPAKLHTIVFDIFSSNFNGQMYFPNQISEALLRFPNVKDASLSCVLEDNMHVVERWTKLEKLHLSRGWEEAVSPRCLDPMPGLTSMKEVMLIDYPADKILEFLKSLPPSLTKITAMLPPPATNFDDFLDDDDDLDAETAPAPAEAPTQQAEQQELAQQIKALFPNSEVVVLNGDEFPKNFSFDGHVQMLQREPAYDDGDEAEVDVDVEAEDIDDE